MLTQPRSAFGGKAFFWLFALAPLFIIFMKISIWSHYGVFDFHTFHQAGLLANSGQFSTIYDTSAFVDHLEKNYGERELLPWFYPPLLLPFCQVLALFPIKIAYAIYGVSSILFYYFTVSAVFPKAYQEIITLTALPLTIPLFFGHPTPMLLCFLIWGYRFSRSNLFMSLVMLTLFAIKPHVGGIVLFFYFLAKLPKTILPSLIIAVITLASFMLLYDWHIWAYFLRQLTFAQEVLSNQGFSTRWVSSFHGFLRALNFPVFVAWLGQLAALIAVCLVGWLTFKANKHDRFWVVASLAAFFTSPYIVFYDVAYLIFPLILVLINTDPTKRKHWPYALVLLETAMLIALRYEPPINLNFVISLSFFALIFIEKARHSQTSATASSRSPNPHP